MDFYCAFGSKCCERCAKRYGARWNQTSPVRDRRFDARIWEGWGSVAANGNLVASLDAHAGIPGRWTLVCPRLVQRLGESVLIAATLTVAAAPAQAQSNSGYDPRSWSYDQARNALVSPSAPDQVPGRNTVGNPREIVDFDEAQRKGSIVINTTKRRLYHLLGDGKALRYAASGGRARVVRSRHDFEQEGLAGLAPASQIGAQIVRH
ncbi:MAG: hypothetical protein E5V62_13115 [Mesorhizobium sp.]|uniref:hypothetical protein n=1 Tax=unclassified Mesorhizobium TaxID=325217 RepID=UPI000F75A530|nr:MULTISPECIES: hypothetical protein [unclassified Mesorhizobium]RVC46735.1 hypothetical protein EN781_04120 [Mesorhizobium sp. M4A.F.Ca.ET.090.04.2.1]RVD71678.1 hypothetical protein EN751_14060 [Mesorhizobium sp. M4A.F.Ca.ET.029.04.2.1]AZO48768.1 hypothetical protein EJ073_13845 [Mesorhizobium sp. M4B.F.Ca.ET.058.02.1.1]RWC20213.1 MAG: hypothetical protein EOS53_10310 [Mesorhizobium sp.]RWD30053.1 MAG: hypothetical protein EOS22_07715 [Mesorhizobium sp.]